MQNVKMCWSRKGEATVKKVFIARRQDQSAAETITFW